MSTGTALSFPIVLTDTGSVDTVSGVDLLKQSITEILSENQGARFMDNGFGGKLHLLKYENNLEIIKSLSKTLIAEALKVDNRIEFIDLDVSRQDNIVYFTILFAETGSNDVSSLVYPFFQSF